VRGLVDHPFWPVTSWASTGRNPLSAAKFLSLYEGDPHVIVRGKAGAAVEFGNTLFLAERRQGLVVDWHLNQESAPADSRQLPESLKRLQSWLPAGVLEAVGGDRGFDSKANRAHLTELGLFNGLCPRGVAELKRHRHGARFGEIQRRRPQTEGRHADPNHHPGPP
jgi:hypothetical protein